MFIKAPDGAFITLGKDKKLSLLTCRTIDGKKAFKIGICQNCKTPYVMGRIENGILCVFVPKKDKTPKVEEKKFIAIEG